MTARALVQAPAHRDNEASSGMGLFRGPDPGGPAVTGEIGVPPPPPPTIQLAMDGRSVCAAARQRPHGCGGCLTRLWRHRLHGHVHTGLAWSADSYQLLALDTAGAVRMWWLRPASGAAVALAARPRQTQWQQGSRNLAPR